MEIEYLVLVLRVSDPFRTTKRVPVPATLALSILLSRLSFPNRLVDLETISVAVNGLMP
ncbi:hypothetical protein RSAG8_09194, partial [Rhizoctonia solani AG-8 WAC10335]